MHALGLCSLEMRQIVESGFLPLRCECLEEEGNTLLIRIHNPETGLVDLSVSGIAHERFSSARAISRLVQELRAELEHRSMPHAKAS